MTGAFHCFHCDYGGHLKSKAKLSDLKAEYKDGVKYSGATARDRKLVLLRKETLTDEQITALLKRGLTEDDITYYQIYGGERIQIPNYVVGVLSDIVCKWEWRKDRVTKYNPKYLYSEGVTKSLSLFNSHRIAPDSHITLCEGIFNAITVGRTAVASYGRSLSKDQLAILLSLKPSLITIAYDSDIPGVTGAADAIEKLQKAGYKGSVDYILLPRGVDINDIGKERYQKYYNKRKVNIDLQSGLSPKVPLLLYKNSLRS